MFGSTDVNVRGFSRKNAPKKVRERIYVFILNAVILL